MTLYITGMELVLEEIMRKKSHISLATYLINSMHTEALVEHKKAFYIGSILPDCIPSFITRRHSIEATFDILKEEISKITEKYDIDRGMDSYYCRHLGVITHYVADYFTFPHNSIFTGSMKEHCIYENDLKKALKQYVHSDAAKNVRETQREYNTVDEICKFIIKMHNEYLIAIKELKVDCLYIVELCHNVVDAILKFFETMILKSKERKVVLA